MISRRLFVDTLDGIKEKFAIRAKAEEELQKLGLSIDIQEDLFLNQMLKVLKETVPDPYDYISWWLYDASDYRVSWEENGQKIEKNLEKADDLYDFLVASAANQPDVEGLLKDMPEKEKGLAPEKMIEQTDFLRYMDAVLSYLNTHDIVIKIAQEGIPQYVLLSKKLYDQFFGELKTPAQMDEDSMVTVEIEVDPELEKKARQALVGTGFTLEQVCEMFLTWCAHYPKDAAEWLMRTKEELETAQ